MKNMMYTVINEYSENKLKNKVKPITKTILSQFIKKGFTFTPKQIIKINKKLIPHNCSTATFNTYHYRAIKEGISCGILSKNDEHLPNNLIKLQSVNYWQSQLRSSKYKNFQNSTITRNSTKGMYLYLLNEFNTWLIKNEFKIKMMMPLSDTTFEKTERLIIFSSVEEMLKLLEDSPSSQIEIKKS